MTTNRPRAGLGASSVLLIIVVLCLTAFGTLTLVTARMDANLTSRTVAAQQAYYQADAAAQEALMQLDLALSASAPVDALWTETADGYKQRFPMENGLVLEVRVAVTGGAYRVVSYRTKNESDWQSETQGLIW